MTFAVAALTFSGSTSPVSLSSSSATAMPSSHRSAGRLSDPLASLSAPRRWYDVSLSAMASRSVSTSRSLVRYLAASRLGVAPWCSWPPGVIRAAQPDPLKVPSLMTECAAADEAERLAELLLNLVTQAVQGY
jgi:hypothetical protein